MSKAEFIKKIGEMSEDLMRTNRIIAIDRMTNEVNAAIRNLNETMEQVWEYNFKVDIYMDKDEKVHPVFYE